MGLDCQAWPPVYTVKKHKRVRGVKLRASQTKGLVITIPPRFNLKHLPAVLEEHKQWILKQLSRLPAPTPDILPTQLALPALNEEWRIDYVPCATKIELIQRPGGQTRKPGSDPILVLVGRVEDQPACKKILMNWLRAYAKQKLTTLLRQCSVETQLPCREVRIRNQQTVWGTCTVNKDISLNYKLIFLPPALMRYVMIHELCHTQHLNHSERFWQLVERFDPDWRQHRRMLRRGDQYIPGWTGSDPGLRV